MVLWIIATICAFYIKGLCGFANTLVFTSILSFGNNNINISPIELLLGYPSNIVLAWKERKYIKLSICIPLILLVILGIIPGIVFLKNTDTTIIKTIFGYIIIIIGSEMLVQEIYYKKTKKITINFDYYRISFWNIMWSIWNWCTSWSIHKQSNRQYSFI